MKRIEKCGTCYFCDKDSMPLTCRVNPVQTKIWDGTFEPFFPTTKPDLWCRSWRQGVGVGDYFIIEFINMKTGCRLGNPVTAKIPEPGNVTATEFRQEDNIFRLDLTWKVVPEKKLNET